MIQEPLLKILKILKILKTPRHSKASNLRLYRRLILLDPAEDKRRTLCSQNRMYQTKNKERQTGLL